MKKFVFLSIIFFPFHFIQAQVKAVSYDPMLARPRLVIGIVVDQMRWDYLYRYYDRFGEGGFKRLIKEGMNCDNTMIPYAQTVTAAGHAAIYTGTVPAINGIVGNDWYDRTLGRVVYCVEDSTVKTLGGAPQEVPMSPVNLWTSTITDELKFATNSKAKVIGIAIKDRGGILPAGHAANAAYWYDPITGNWVSSTYYMDSLPGWVRSFNNRKMVDSLYKLDWNTLYPLNSYVDSDPDEKPYEGDNAKFPHLLSQFAGKNYQMVSATPHGNSLTLEFAKSALLSEELGKDEIPDFLAVSLSSPDYIGHRYGPTSIEVEDNYLRLDKGLKAFFDFLDLKVGKGKYTLFLTADHGASHSVGYLMEHKVPGMAIKNIENAADKSVAQKLGLTKLVLSQNNSQYYLDYQALDKANLNHKDVINAFIEELNKDPRILLAFNNRDISAVNLPAEVKEMFQKGFNLKRGGDVQVMLKPSYFQGAQTGTTHGTWYPYDAHVPLLFMGWGINPGRITREVHTTDIAVTLSALLHLQMPSGNIGKVIEEVLK